MAQFLRRALAPSSEGCLFKFQELRRSLIGPWWNPGFWLVTILLPRLGARYGVRSVGIPRKDGAILTNPPFLLRDNIEPLDGYAHGGNAQLQRTWVTIWLLVLLGKFRSENWKWPVQARPMPPWWPSAWTSARHFHNKEGVSSSRSLLAPTSPSPWTPRRLGLSTRPRRGSALQPSEEMQSAELNFWARNHHLKLLLLLVWKPTRSVMISFSVTNVIQHSKHRMVWKFTKGKHTKKNLRLKRSEILLLNLPWFAPPLGRLRGSSPATTVAWICRHLTNVQVIQLCMMKLLWKSRQNALRVLVAIILAIILYPCPFLMQLG